MIRASVKGVIETTEAEQDFEDAEEDQEGLQTEVPQTPLENETWHRCDEPVFDPYARYRGMPGFVDSGENSQPYILTLFADIKNKYQL